MDWRVESSSTQQQLNTAQTCRELVLIDPAVASPDVLLAGLRPGLEARLLTTDEPAPAQIARAVAGRSLDAVHVIAHGQPGAVAFSGGLLGVQALGQHRQALEAIGAALADTGALMLWCCRTAAGAAGTAFLQSLARITGVPVAASTSLVGAAASGGSWRLDQQAGAGATAAAPLTASAIASYSGVMAIYSEQTGTDNPFAEIDVRQDSSPSFADIDGDGDLDLVVGGGYEETLTYFENTGSADNPNFIERTGADNPFFGISYRSSPSFADIDGDDDLDLILGEFVGLSYLENIGTANNPNFIERTGAADPFDGIDVGISNTPAFADVDGDGDLDVVIGNLYGTLNYFENTGSATTPIYTQRTGTSNPFDGIDVGSGSSSEFVSFGDSAPSLADIDGDGDLDLVIGDYYGTLNYFENTGSATSPTYTQRTGTSNPFDGIDVGNISAPAFADIDDDGDLDAVVGEGSGTLNYLLNVVCFLPGTLIATPTGERPIETLQPGDLICTADGVQPVKFLSCTRRHRQALLALGKMPIRIRAGALGELGPSRDTYMSPSHAIALDGHLVEAGALLNGSSIRQLDPECGVAFFTYYNIELEAHGLIWANGMPVETYFANVRGIGFTREDWDNYDDYLGLYGSSELMQELPLPRIPFARLIPDSLRRRFQLEEQTLTLFDLATTAL